MMNPTLTLSQLQRARLYDALNRLLTNLDGSGVDMDTCVSLGDIAMLNGAVDAWQCARCLDWSAPAVRRAVIAALLPTLGRAVKHTTDQRVHDCIAALRQWCAGEDVDLEAAAAAAAAAATTTVEYVAATAAAAATWAARAAGRSLWAARVADAAEGAAWATTAVAETRTKTEMAERAAQRADLIRAFPPLF